MRHCGRRSKNLSYKRAIIAVSTCIGLFIVINVALLFIFSGKTYPNTKLGSLSIGSVSYDKLVNKINSQSLLPQKIILVENGNKVTTNASALGISANTSKISARLKQKSWLPLANLFTSHSSQVFMSVDKIKLNDELNTIAAKYNESATGASIQMVNGEFTLASDKTGNSLDMARAITQVINGIENNHLNIVLPTSKTQPTVTTASLETNLNSLKSAQNLSLTYTYNGKSTKATAADIAGWYILSGNTYAVSAANIQSYISGVGKADGINVENLASAVSSTQNALSKLTSLSFALTAVPNTACSSNTISQLILVSISQQHLWACNGPNQAYDSAVVTGDEQHADTLTPIGTYHIYAKETNKVLTGSDENGSWSDHVSYWMPWLDNQYGAYGFHDATWRAPTDFGNININTSAASNGCVELPLATAAWLYGWDELGTTVKIES